MVRPCFLVIDREHAGSISTRKLVIETAKFNVITAYSGSEAIETLRLYHAVNGVVLDTGLRDMPCTDLVTELRRIRPDLVIVSVGSPGARWCEGATHHLESFEPKQLLTLLQGLEPDKTAAIQRHDRALEQE